MKREQTANDRLRYCFINISAPKQQVAKSLGIDFKEINGMLSGLYPVSFEVAYKMQCAYGFNSNWILYAEQPVKIQASSMVEPIVDSLLRLIYSVPYYITLSFFKDVFVYKITETFNSLISQKQKIDDYHLRVDVIFREVLKDVLIELETLSDNNKATFFDLSLNLKVNTENNKEDYFLTERIISLYRRILFIFEVLRSSKDMIEIYDLIKDRLV